MLKVYVCVTERMHAYMSVPSRIQDGALLCWVVRGLEPETSHFVSPSECFPPLHCSSCLRGTAPVSPHSVFNGAFLLKNAQRKRKPLASLKSCFKKEVLNIGCFTLKSTRKRISTPTILDCSEIVYVVRNRLDKNFCNIILLKYQLKSEKLR